MIGISNKPGTLKLYGAGGGASFDSENPWVKDSPTTEIKVHTLESVCNKYWRDNEQCHFLKIDVEGFEKQVLEGMNFSKYRPWIVVMESTLPNTEIPCHDKWEHILLNNDYKFLGKSGINRYYVAKEKEQILSPFYNAEELDKKHKIVLFEDAIVGQEVNSKRRRRQELKVQFYYSKAVTPVRIIYRGIKYSKLMDAVRRLFGRE